MAPIIGSFFKMAVPFIVILPGLLAWCVLRDPDGTPDAPGGRGRGRRAPGMGLHSYNEVLPLMLARYCGPGLLGLGITALIAGFMSGMAGNVSAFSTVWTYDIYRPLINKNAPRRALRHRRPLGHDPRRHHLHRHGLPGDAAPQGIMDYVQALFSFFIAPLFGTVLLGMFWKRATQGRRFLGPAAGHAVVGRHVGVGQVRSRGAALRGLSPDAKAMAENMYRALWSVIVSMGVTVVVSLLTKPKTGCRA